MNKNYEWLIDLLKKEFPEGKILTSTFDMGSGFGIGIELKGKRLAVSVKGFEQEPIEWANIYDEDEGKVVRKPIKFKITKDWDLNIDPKKEQKTKAIIERFHKVLGN